MSEQSWGQDLISKRAQNSGVCSAPLITMTGLWVIVVLKVWRISVRRKCTVEGKVHLIHAFFFVVFALQRQGSGAAAGNNKTSGEQGKQKNNKTYIISKTPNFTNVTFQQPPKRSILKSDVCSTFKIIFKKHQLDDGKRDREWWKRKRMEEEGRVNGPQFTVHGSNVPEMSFKSTSHMIDSNSIWRMAASRIYVRTQTSWPRSFASVRSHDNPAGVQGCHVMVYMTRRTFYCRHLNWWSCLCSMTH